MSSNSDYQSFAKNECENKVKVKVNGEEKHCFTLFQQKHKATAAAIEKGLVPFKVAAQTLVDVVDPYSFLGSSYNKGALSVPTMLVQINGDKVVPNGDAKSYGTNGLNQTFKDNHTGYEFFTTTEEDYKTNGAHHSSLLAPDPKLSDVAEINKSLGVTKKVQTEVVDFLIR
jgi:hypothetical protein